jgi:hypothetical protein
VNIPSALDGESSRLPDRWAVKIAWCTLIKDFLTNGKGSEEAARESEHVKMHHRTYRIMR